MEALVTPASLNDYAKARRKMVQEQVVARGITEPRVIAAMEKVPRHRFVDHALADRAYSDRALPIGEKQTISQPYVVARSLAALGLTGSERVLEIGVGSGYQAALLAECAKRVYGVERLSALSARAQRLLEELGYGNVIVRTGDGTEGWKEQAPFDAIVVAAGSPGIPQPLVDQLADGGRMVIPVDRASGASEEGEPAGRPKADQGRTYRGNAQSASEEGSQVLTLVRRRGTEVTTERLDDVVFVPLIGRYGRREE